MDFTVEEILERYRYGELVRDNDETGQGGFWDYAGMLVTSAAGDSAISPGERELWQETIYNAMLEVMEAMPNYLDEALNKAIKEGSVTYSHQGKILTLSMRPTTAEQPAHPRRA